MRASGSSMPDAAEHAHALQPRALLVPAQRPARCAPRRGWTIGEHFRQRSHRCSPSKSVMVKRPMWMSCAASNWSQIWTTPLSSAIDAVCSLNVLPGSYMPVTARLNRSSVRRAAESVRVVVGQADHRQHLAGVHVHHDAARADRLEFVHRLGQFVTHHRLHARVDREASAARDPRTAAGRNTCSTPATPCSSTSTPPSTCAATRPHRIMPLLRWLEIRCRECRAASIASSSGAARTAALQPDELLVRL